MQTCICPACGTQLSVTDPSRKQMFCRKCGAKIKLETAAPSAPCQEIDPREAEIKRLQQELEIERLKHQQEMERLNHEQEQLKRKAELEKERSKIEEEDFFSRYEVITTDDPDGIPIDDFLSGNFTSFHGKTRVAPDEKLRNITPDFPPEKTFFQNLADDGWRKDHPGITLIVTFVVMLILLIISSIPFVLTSV